MNEYLFIFRMNITEQAAQPTPEQMKAYMVQWSAWIDDIDRQGQLAPGGHHLNREGVVLRKDQPAEHMPYTAGKESVAGYILVRAKDQADALRLAQGCPILNGEGTSVEVRAIAAG